jgi:hypothetical protein
MEPISLLINLLVLLVVLFVIDYIVRMLAPDARIVMIVRVILLVVALIWILKLFGGLAHIAF